MAYNTTFPEFNDIGSSIVSFCDFSTTDLEVTRTVSLKSNASVYTDTTGNSITYDHKTEEYYRALRASKCDPITMEMQTDQSFSFPYQWDPYTGERLSEDPHGSLYFDPVALAKHFYHSRTNNLWISESDENGGFYQGYYGDAVGAGEDFEVKGRGNYPEWYLFRLPIPDCYLTEDHNPQIVTFGPKLTNDEIKELDKKLQLMSGIYKRYFRCNPPSLVKMKQLYDLAIDRNPNVPNADSMTYAELAAAKNKMNRDAVQALLEMRG